MKGLLDCGCDVDHNALTLCQDHYDQLCIRGVLEYDVVELAAKKRRITN